MLIKNKLSELKLPIILSIIGIILYFIFRWYFKSEPRSIDISLSQYVVFPIFLLAFSLVFYNKWLKLLVWVLAIIVIMTFYLEYNIAVTAPSDLVLTRLPNDQMESKTRIFQRKFARVKKRAGNYDAGIDSNTTIHRYPFTVSSELEAKTFLDKNKAASMLVWGDDKYLTVSFPAESVVPISKIKAEIPLSELYIVLMIPEVLISYEPVDGTADFMFSLASGIKFYNQYYKNSDEYSFSQSEFWLQKASLSKARWTTGTHMAVVRFLLGNLYLKKSIISGSTDLGVIECAINSYNSALKFLVNSDNIYVQAAIYNNLAVATSDQKLKQSHLMGLRRSLKILQKIVTLHDVDGVPDLKLVARINQQRIRNLIY